MYFQNYRRKSVYKHKDLSFLSNIYDLQYFLGVDFVPLWVLSGLYIS